MNAVSEINPSISKWCRFLHSVVFPSSGIFCCGVLLELNSYILPSIGETWDFLGALSPQNMAP